MNRVAGRSWVVLLLVLALIAGMAFFVMEFTNNARAWVFFDGSPHVYSGAKPAEGILVDREGKLLLNLSGSWTYSADPLIRRSTLHWVGDRLGNVSAPVLSRYADEMTSFDLLNGIYAYGSQPGRMELTLSAKAQAAALEALGDRKGTVAVYNYKTGELLCAVSTPTYDPDQVPDFENDPTGLYEGVYLNRFTQATYTPGSIFKLVTAAAALETVPDILEQSFTCTGELEVGGGTVSCETAHGELDFEHALVYSCNCSFAQIALQVGGDRLQRYADTFGITRSLSFDGIATAPGSLEAADAASYELAWCGIGQHTDLVNPCQYLSFVGAIAGGGSGVLPHVVQEIAVGGSRTYESEAETAGRLMSVSTAEKLKEMMGLCVQVKYGAENFPDVTVCGKSGTAEKDGDETSNALFTGFVDDPDYPLAFIAVVQEGGYGTDACIPILNRVLTVCMEVLDAE